MQSKSHNFFSMKEHNRVFTCYDNKDYKYAIYWKTIYVFLFELCEQLTDGWSTKGYSKWDYSRLAASH